MFLNKPINIECKTRLELRHAFDRKENSSKSHYSSITSFLPYAYIRFLPFSVKVGPSDVSKTAF